MAEKKNTNTNRGSAVLSIALVTFMLGLVGLIVIYAVKVNDHLRQQLPFSVYLSDSASVAEVDALKSYINKAGYATSIKHVDKATAYENYKKDLGADNVIEVVGENFLPASLELTLKPEYANPVKMAELKTSLMKDKAVSDVTYSNVVTGELNNTAQNVGIAVFGFAILLTVVCVSLINSSIRLDIYSKRLLIKSMLLVGATQGFIRKPFISRSFINGLIAWAIAIALIAGMLVGITLNTNSLQFGLLIDFNYLAPLAGALLVLGLLISYLSTLLALQRYLKTRTDQLY